jgi:threonine dehydrogenase-like Zn-dependent dehydrogenase
VVAGAITPDWFAMESQAGHPSQSGGPLGGWQFSNTRDGVFGEYFLVNQADANLAQIPDSVSDEAAVYCCDMLSTGFAGAEIGNIPIGGTVAVFALGPVGLMAVAGAKLRGAGLIIGVDTVEKRFQLAREYGADRVLDFADTDVVEDIRSLTGGEGVDTAIEALGSNQTFQQCIQVTKAGGTVSNIGYHGEGEFLHVPRAEWGVGMSEIDLKNILCPGGRLRMSRLLRILENNRLDPTKMTTHTMPFDEIDRGFELMEEKLEGVIKPLITF